MTVTLQPGQYQLGDIRFGAGTNIIVTNFDAQPYDLNAQDYQTNRSDAMRFGYDSFKPTAISISMEVIYNWKLPPFVNGNFWMDKPKVEDLAAAWRGDSIRNEWGAIMPLYFCGRDGITRVIYGRPGQFTAEKPSHRSTIIKCMGEFRRADTLAYSTNESYVQLSSNAAPQYLMRTNGNAASWLRIVGVGPLVNPVITVGENQVELNITVTDKEVFEISSYPWQRRAVKSDATNLRNNLVGETPYLDKMTLPVNEFVPVRWTANNVNMWQPALGNANWNVDIESNQWRLPLGFTSFGGTFSNPRVRLDLFNPTGITKFIGGNELGGVGACLYTTQTFNTTTQFMQARVVEPFNGRSALVIMSNLGMTNYALLEVESDGLIGSNNKLIIRTGTAWNTWSSARATYVKGSGWGETDVIGFGYNPTTKVFTGYLNGVARVTWTDSGNVVTANATTNKYSGFVFDMSNALFTLGTGFKDITAYDNVLTPVDTGSVTLYWRDAWSSIE